LFVLSYKLSNFPRRTENGVEGEEEGCPLHSLRYLCTVEKELYY